MIESRIENSLEDNFLYEYAFMTEAEMDDLLILRTLASVEIDENTTMALEYDENGMRSKKTIETLVAGDVLKEEYSY